MRLLKDKYSAFIHLLNTEYLHWSTVTVLLDPQNRFYHKTEEQEQ